MRIIHRNINTHFFPTDLSCKRGVRIIHGERRYIRVCTALHNYLLQSLIDMRSGNCENEWRSQPFVLLLLEKYMRMLHEYFRLLYFIY